VRLAFVSRDQAKIDALGASTANRSNSCSCKTLKSFGCNSSGISDLIQKQVPLRQFAIFQSFGYGHVTPFLGGKQLASKAQRNGCAIDFTND